MCLALNISPNADGPFCGRNLWLAPEGSVDLEEAEHGRGAGAALQPHHHGRLGGVYILKAGVSNLLCWFCCEVLHFVLT